jgi:hypothetical protein
MFLHGKSGGDLCVSVLPQISTGKLREFEKKDKRQRKIAKKNAGKTVK